MRYADFIGNPKFATSVEGLYYDFNNGPRLLLPEGNFDITYIDKEYATVLCHKSVLGKQIVRTEFCDYVDWKIRIETNGKEICTLHQDLRGKNILVDLIGNPLGDTIIAMSVIEKFCSVRQCNTYVLISQNYKEIFQRSYPEIHFVAVDSKQREVAYTDIPDKIYATYFCGGYFSFLNSRGSKIPWPVDYKVVGTINYWLIKFGLDEKEEINNTLLPSFSDKSKRIIKEPYVCISGRASENFKEWNNENGWMEVTKYLLGLGYRIICIDGSGMENGSPLAKALEAGMEDFTGYKPLQERVDLLHYADFYIGLPSGLSWLAWGSGTKVIMIGGAALPKTDFYTPYKVINNDVCNGCINDSYLNHDGMLFYPCENTEHYSECTKLIFPEIVCKNIYKLMVDNHLLPPVARKSRE